MEQNYPTLTIEEPKKSLKELIQEAEIAFVDKPKYEKKPSTTEKIDLALNLFGGEVAQHLRYEYLKDKRSDLSMVLEKLNETVQYYNIVGKKNCKYRFINYLPNFVDADPYYYYFNEEEDLKKFLCEDKSIELSQLVIIWNNPKPKISVVKVGEKTIGYIDEFKGENDGR